MAKSLLLAAASLFSVLLTALACQAQQLTNLTAHQTGGNDIEISYQLAGPEGRAFAIALYSSHDNYTTPLKNVEGDVGQTRVVPGTRKVIHWHVKDELQKFDGDLAFEVRAVMLAPLFSKISTSLPKVKRGKEVTIHWEGGLPGESVAVELVSGGKIVAAGSVPNSRRFAYTIPDKTKPGTYEVVLKQAGEVSKGGSLVIQPKYAWYIKAAPVVVAGVVVAIIVLGGKEEFPEPPDLTSD